METLTHALSGALLARATVANTSDPAALSRGISLSRTSSHRTLSTKARVLTGGLAAAFPDADIVLRSIDTLTYLNWHQGVTHSLLLLPAWALVLAWLFSRATRGHYHWRLFYSPVCLGLAVHIAGDVFTAYAPMLLAPFSDQRFSLPFIYLIDPLFTAIVAGGLAVSLLLPRGRFYAWAALSLVAGYVVFQGILHARALEIGKVHAVSHGLVGAKVDALPQPFTPYNWMIIVSHGEGYEVARVNLRRRNPAFSDQAGGLLRSIHAAHQPVANARWRRYWRYGETETETDLVSEAWNRPDFAGFRRFAVFPALAGIERNDDRVCVRFKDLRFELPSLPTSFRYDICHHDAADTWRLERVRGAFWID